MTFFILLISSLIFFILISWNLFCLYFSSIFSLFSNISIWISIFFKYPFTCWQVWYAVLSFFYSKYLKFLSLFLTCELFKIVLRFPIFFFNFNFFSYWFQPKLYRGQRTSVWHLFFDVCWYSLKANMWLIFGNEFLCAWEEFIFCSD